MSVLPTHSFTFWHPVRMATAREVLRRWLRAQTPRDVAKRAVFRVCLWWILICASVVWLKVHGTDTATFVLR